ncbi:MULTISPECIES: D-alanyl-D-alanine carboxypeptidase family protein [unclassified Frigoribacterium]|uniref:M15 family metallopeptidase n=1 Tax=unclassified Frigoribacterium TaxID=2627005 RepID=UPI0006F6850B|nr:MULTISPECIES: M15 family metallopeptidase [unclassified Frigoribacterium]KQO46594.1 hypothetical protein ASF07_02420 [Frigoribacterium sp. Leaf254]KQT38687.1 hypothetical protein ASG28_02420 [Frigoribacterium sp. Leaf415]
MPLDDSDSRSLPAGASVLDRRRLLAYAGAVGAAAVAVGAADGLRPRSARAALLLAEATVGVDTVEEAVAQAALSAWGGQSNGRIPASMLELVPASVAGSGFLRDDAARQFFGLGLAFQSAVGRPLRITEGYRSYDRQVDYWNRYQAGTGNLAAYPGTSNHGWGISCDFGSGVETSGSSAKRWMDANAPSFGWSPTGNTFSRPEPWHFDFVSAYTGPANAVQNDSGLIALRVPEAMPGVGTSYTCVLGFRFLRHFTTIEKVNAFRAIGVPYFDAISRSHFELLVDALSIPRSAVVTDADYWRA